MDKEQQAAAVIRKHVLWAAGAGLVPIPVLDIAAVTVVQIDLLRKLAQLYGAHYSHASAKTFLLAVTGSTFARLGASLVKAIPGIGTVLGGVSMSVLSGASTYAVGQVAMKVFAGKGDLRTVNLLEAKSVYDEAFEDGKQFVADLEDEVHDTNDVVAALEKLHTLRQKGIITAEEFEVQKQNLLEKL